MATPGWVQDAVFYQIFPDRFANGDHANDPDNVQPWGAAPSIYGFQGGDLAGILQRLDYLQDLGVTALYLNPIFASASNHRYNTYDYYRIDPRLGTMDDFHALLKAVHGRGMRLILDGVFNHCGRGFFAFNDILENQEHSSYLNWFHVNSFPVDAYSPGDATTFEAWWKFKSLPKFNTDTPAVRRYLQGVGRYWIEQGIDGWRLDVPNEIDDDPFWAEFRQGVRTANPEAYLCGEIWDAQPRWLGEGHFDGLMNYPLREAVLGFLNGKFSGKMVGERLENLLGLYARENTFAMYNLLGSHDTERMLTLLGRSVEKARLAFLMLFAYPGAPAIYYGDEIGLEGGKDPDCRRAFPTDESQWNHELRAWLKKLIALRKQTAALRQGNFRHVEVDDGGYAFARCLPGSTVLMVINNSASPKHLEVRVDGLGFVEGQELTDLLGSGSVTVKNMTVSLLLPALSGVWLG